MSKQIILAVKPRSQPQEQTEVLPNVRESVAEQPFFFQAIGIIRGDVVVDGDKGFIKIRGKCYPLGYAGANRKGGVSSSRTKMYGKG